MFPLATMLDPDADEWPDENDLVQRPRQRLDTNPPAILEEVAGAWEEPYLRLQFRSVDGSALDVSHGDGYTAITGKQVEFHGGLSTDELARVLFGILDGTARHVVRRKVGAMVTEHFEVANDPTRIGIYTGGIIFMHRYAFDKLLPVPARTSYADLSLSAHSEST